MILNKIPSAQDFYATYWNKKPFIVRGAIEASAFEHVIDGDHLAGLSLEEDIKSRIIKTLPEKNAWSCEYGPFEEELFAQLGEENWSLLVQNVEEYHPNTVNLLPFFDFAPQWLMDDIMVSYSTKGGSVGPHIDSYHVFLVQGSGKRRWKVGSSPIENAEYIPAQDIKVLKYPFDGEEVETTIGDVIYIPPNFAHQGTTLEESLTFSIGFLGPKVSDLLIEYGHHLEQVDRRNPRYSGAGLTTQCAGFSIHKKAETTLQTNLVNAIQSEEFSLWLAEYFSKSPDEDEG